MTGRHVDHRPTPAWIRVWRAAGIVAAADVGLILWLALQPA